MQICDIRLLPLITFCLVLIGAEIDAQVESLFPKYGDSDNPMAETLSAFKRVGIILDRDNVMIPDNVNARHMRVADAQKGMTAKPKGTTYYLSKELAAQFLKIRLGEQWKIFHSRMTKLSDSNLQVSSNTSPDVACIMRKDGLITEVDKTAFSAELKDWNSYWIAIDKDCISNTLVDHISVHCVRGRVCYAEITLKTSAGEAGTKAMAGAIVSGLGGQKVESGYLSEGMRIHLFTDTNTEGGGVIKVVYTDFIATLFDELALRIRNRKQSARNALIQDATADIYSPVVKPRRRTPTSVNDRPPPENAPIQVNNHSYYNPNDRYWGTNATSMRERRYQSEGQIEQRRGPHMGHKVSDEDMQRDRDLSLRYTGPRDQLPIMPELRE
jgi:hypothetical protein